MTRAKNWVLLALISVFSTFALWLPAGLFKVYENFDGPYYLVVAKSWYDKQIISHTFSFPLPAEYYAAHFPLYPALINLIPGFNSLQAMVIVNVLATALCAVVLYEIFKKLNLTHPLLLTTIWLFWWPRMWVVRSIGSPETLFILFVFSSLYFFEKRKYLLAGLLGALAVLTKSPGILLALSYGLWIGWSTIKTKKFNWQVWPVILIPLSLVLLFTIYYYQTGDFLAYFHSGDNIHLQALPFKVFDSSQPWVGDWWLDGVIWIYLVGGIGTYLAIKRNLIWGMFGAVFYISILFVSHRDIGRYALPLVPVVILGLHEVLTRREVRWVLLLAIIPLYFYSLNFLLHNATTITDWSPFL